jgi:hypothetical protein
VPVGCGHSVARARRWTTDGKCSPSVRGPASRVRSRAGASSCILLRSGIISHMAHASPCERLLQYTREGQNTQAGALCSPISSKPGAPLSKEALSCSIPCANRVSRYRTAWGKGRFSGTILLSRRPCAIQALPPNLLSPTVWEGARMRSSRVTPVGERATMAHLR